MTETQRVLDARKRLVEAFHAMHLDQRISVSEALATELDRAWASYDRAIINQYRQDVEADGRPGPIL
jgi:hypothetical protein